MIKSTHERSEPASTDPQVHADITFARLEEAILKNDDSGFCTHCGAETNGVEPDAERYPCEECATNRVYGAEQLLVLELFHQRN